MNLIGIIILCAVIIDHTVHVWADILNLKRLSTRIPDEFKDVYNKQHYRKSQEYLLVNTRFGWIVSSFNLLVLFIFWFGKGFYFLDLWIRSFDLGTIFTGLFYVGTLIVLKTLLSLPFDIYATFIIEDKFGFNKTSWKTYTLDILKGFALGLLLGGPLLAGVLVFFEYFGENAWIFCWITLTIYTLFVQFIVPTWIMPIFNKFVPIEEGDLKKTIVSYANSIDFPLENIFIMDGSRRSSKSNAFFTGFGKNRRIVLYDTLISQHTTSEIISILAHEIGHYKKKHVLWMILFGVLQTGLMLYLLSFFISNQNLFDAFYMDQKSVYTGLIFFAMLYAPMDFFTGILIGMHSRNNEYEADRFSVTTTKDSGSMTEALKKLSVHNLSNLIPHPFYVFLNHSHPPVIDRIKYIQSI